jgi:hypothetical protein
MSEHRWSGWPGAWCLDCGAPDPREGADGLNVDPMAMQCREPWSRRHDPYHRRADGEKADREP